VTIEELTEGVLELCVGERATLEDDLHPLRDGLLKKVDEDVALGELFMLRISIAVYAVQRFFRPAVQQEVRDAFNRRLHAMLMDSEDKKVKSQPNKVIDEMNKRCQQYLEAIQAPHHLGPARNVGNVFASLCGRERDLDVIGVGLIQFGCALKAVKEFLNQCKAMEGGGVINLSEK
jgi:hypothetical protein